MIRDDLRSRRVVIVADFLINPNSAFYADIKDRPGPVFDVLIEDGWGIMKAPPHILDECVSRSAVATIAGDAADYLGHDHTVIIMAADGLPRGGVWLDQFENEFRELQMPLPTVVTLRLDDASRTAAAVRAMLAPFAGPVTIETTAKA